ncbi:MAG TPA: hypothetical protein VLI41_13305 [Phenylobacterium sp.]|uniref:hypothetical protein n=1 Tax=Phenylobacterium sp. TaxID=1871053 RepID=UPI002C946F9D|nr:hypothetical protein [Phenylobacterium sp.]HSV04172.1 hypothetical protein [Phenylobacterium sp.]
MAVEAIRPAAAPPRARAVPARAFGLAGLGLALLALAAARVWLAAVQPLWFDEAWSLMAATTPDWASLVHEALTDVNAPLGYVLLRAWVGLAGASDLALRLPALAAIAAAGALPLLWGAGLRREARLAWAVMIFAWWGVDGFLAGRAYGLLLALSTAQVIAFAELLRKPRLGTAFAWAALGALAILTHYYALIVTAVQGLSFLALRRREALRCWPAALAFAPAFGWIAAHAPRLQAFAGAEVAWHPTVGPGLALAMTAATLQPSAPLLGLAVALGVLAAAGLSRAPAARLPPPMWIAAGASAAALALTLVSGALHPSLTARYLIPTVPGLLLGLVLCAAQTSRARLLLAGLAMVWLGAALRPDAFLRDLASPSPYGFETASEVLMRHGARDVVFAWDHEVTALMPPPTLERLGSVFFRRAGYPVRVRPLVVRPGDDVNALALAAASGPHPGLIWIYNRAGRTAARAHPPAIARLDPRWRCERIGDDTVGSLACWRTPRA